MSISELSPEEKEALEALAAEHGGDMQQVVAMYAEYKKAKGSLSELTGLYAKGKAERKAEAVVLAEERAEFGEDLDLAEVFANEGAHNQPIEQQSAQAQDSRKKALHREIELRPDDEEKAPSRKIKGELSFDVYMQRWLAGIQKRLKLGKSEADQQTLYETFLSDTRLIGHLSVEDVKSLAGLCDRLEDCAGPNQHLAEYLAIEASKSEDITIKRHYFLNAAKFAHTDYAKKNHAEVSLDENVPIRYFIDLDRVMIKETMRRYVDAQHCTQRALSEKAGISKDILVNCLSLTKNAMPSSDNVLSVIAGNEERKVILDKMVHQLIYPEGIQNSFDLMQSIAVKKGQTIAGKKSLTNELSTTKLSKHLSRREWENDTYALIMVKSWLSEHISKGEYTHIGITPNMLEQWEFKDIPLVSSERKDEDVDRACYECDVILKDTLHALTKFVLKKEKKTAKAVAKDMGIKDTAFFHKILPDKFGKFTLDEATRLVDWLEETLQDKKYDTIRDMLPDREGLIELMKAVFSKRADINDIPSTQTHAHHTKVCGDNSKSKSL